MKNKVEGVQFPLKMKFIITLVLLMGFSMGFYLWFARDLIQKDKMAYIYDSILLQNQQHSNEIQSLITNFYFLSENLIDKEDIPNLYPNIVQLMVDNEIYFEKGPISYQYPLIDGKFTTTIEEDNNYKTISFQRIVNGKKIQILAKIEIHKTQFEEGIYHFNGNPLTKGSSLIDKNTMTTILKSSFNKGVYLEERTNQIVSYVKKPELKWFFVMTMSRERALAVSNYIVKKSLYFGSIVFGCFILIGVVLVSPLTSQLEKLYGLTRKVAQGDFSQRLEVSSKDEVGALSSSFNFMSEKIVQYMEQMKEKFRLENEMKVAQMVQKAFFPAGDILNKDFSLDAFSVPATECGGDWWGISEIQDKTLIIIADATGHGVPAALLTATINCCKHNLAELAKTDQELLSSPNRVMQFLNQAIVHAGNKVQMTCFVAIYDQSTKVLHYANASHNQPFYLSSNHLKSLDRKHFQPLMCQPGPRLGEGLEAHYEENKLELSPSDYLCFYTDGIIEVNDEEGKNWGVRRFTKFLVDMVNGQKVGSDILTELKDYSATDYFEDDLTLVMAKVK